MKIFSWTSLYNIEATTVDNVTSDSELYTQDHHALQLTTDRVMTQAELEQTSEWSELVATLQPYTILTQIIGDIPMAITAITPDLIARLISLFGKIGLDVKGLQDAQSTLESNQGDIATLSTTDKTSVVNAINEVKAQVNNIDLTALLDDSSVAADKGWSSQKIVAEMQAKFDSIIAGAPGTLDTLNEIAAVLQNNPDILTTIQAALAKAVRVDIEQTFTTVEKVQGRANIGAASEADLTQLAANVGPIDTLTDAAYTGPRDAA